MCGDYNLRREKRYVEVDVRFTPDGIVVCDQDQITADAGHQRKTHPLPSIGRHSIWRII